VLTPDLCIAFAGNPDLAHRAMRSLPELSGDAYRTVTAHFLRHHLEGDQQAEFLVLFNKPSPKIVAIREGRMFAPASSGWLGDHAAFDAFQRYRHTREPRPVASQFEALQVMTHESERNPKNVTQMLIGAMRYVLIDPTIDSVQGSCVAVNNVEGHFTYRQYALLLSERRSTIILPSASEPASLAERAELREYAESCFITSPDSQIQGVAFHFAVGRVTHMHWGQPGGPLTNARVIGGMNIEEFERLTLAEYGAQWRGIVALRTPPPAEYGALQRPWQATRIRRGG
jgi:hypothetical protein